MKEINLNDILQYNLAVHGKTIKCTDEDYQIILKAMRHVCYEVLDLAVENAMIIDEPYSYCGNTGSEYPPKKIINSKSILQIKNWIK
jgi:hypothetical protein